MLYTRLNKKIFNGKFLIAIFVLFLMYIFGNAGTVFSLNESETILGVIIARIKGNDVHNMYTSYLYHASNFWNNNTYTIVVIPFIACITSIISYNEEIRSGNKKLVLSRSTKLKYYSSEIISTIITSGLIVLISVLVYQLILAAFFDPADVNDDNFKMVYTMLGNSYPNSAEEMNLVPLYLDVAVSIIKFVLYGVKCALFAQAVAVIVRDIYLTLGITVFSAYFHYRIWLEVSMTGFNRENRIATNIADIINPVFLNVSGNYGFYEDKVLLALAVDLLICLFWVIVYYKVSEMREDVSLG